MANLKISISICGEVQKWAPEMMQKRPWFSYPVTIALKIGEISISNCLSAVCSIFHDARFHFPMENLQERAIKHSLA